MGVRFGGKMIRVIIVLRNGVHSPKILNTMNPQKRTLCLITEWRI